MIIENIYTSYKKVKKLINCQQKVFLINLWDELLSLIKIITIINIIIIIINIIVIIIISSLRKE